MKKVNGLIAIIIVLAIIAASMCAWAISTNIQLKQAKAQLAAAQSGNRGTAADDNAIAAEFNGGSVSVAEAREEYGAIATYYLASGVPEEEFSADLKQTVLETLAEEKILYAKAKTLGLTDLTGERKTALEAQVTAEFEDNVAYYAQFHYDENKTEEEIRAETVAYLNDSGLSYEEMLAQAEEGAWRDALYAYAVKDAKIDDETLKEYYEAQVVSDEMTYSVSFAEYEADANAGRPMAWNPEGVRKVETILIPFDEAQEVHYINIQAELASGNISHLDDIDAMYAELEPTANEVAAQLTQGADFAQLRAQYGELNPGYSYVSNESVAYGDDFKEAAISLEKIGDISKPVHVDRGIVIIRYAGDVAPGTVAFEDIKEQLRESCADQYKQEVYSNFVVQCLTEANIKYYPDRV